MFPVDRMRERNIHRETAAPKYNKPPMKMKFYCTNIEMLKWQLLHQRILWPIFMEYWLIFISGFLFAKEVGWEALATKSYTDTVLMCFWHQIHRRKSNENVDQ